MSWHLNLFSRTRLNFPNPGGRGFNPPPRSATFFWEIDHEIFSTVILSLPLIQEGQLSVPGERKCTILVNRLEDYDCPVNLWLGKLTALDMTPLGWLGRKTSTQTNFPNPSGFLLLWFEPRWGHMWESQVLLTYGQVVFPRVLWFSPTFYETRLNISEIFLKGP